MDFVATTDFEIPAHAANHEVVAEKTWRRPGTLYELLPHMHLRGKAFRYELIRADGTESVLLDVPRYDFNWQLSYRFEDPLRMEVGDKIRATAWYDNSEANPANPDPTRSVHYGEQSFEEISTGLMMVLVREQGDEVLRDHVQELRAAADVAILDSELN